MLFASPGNNLPNKRFDTLLQANGPGVVNSDEQPVIGGLPAIEAHVPQVQHLVMSLVANAVEAIGSNRAGSVEVRTRSAVVDSARLAECIAAHEPAPGRCVALEVQDDGCGMDETTLRQLFQPYFTTKGDKGTGLGMTVIEQIITLAGGFIDVDSAPGKGSRFRLRLPVEPPLLYAALLRWLGGPPPGDAD